MVYFSKKTSLSLAEQAYTKFPWQLERLLDSSFAVSSHLFIFAFLSSFVIKLQLFEVIYFIFFGACLSRTDNTVSLNFDSGEFVISNFYNSFFFILGESCRSQNSFNSFSE